MTTRRKFFALALAGSALTMLAACQPRSALQPAGTRIGAIRVDVSRIAAQGWGENARNIQLAMERKLATILGPAYQPGAGPTLQVVVRGVWLASYAGGGGGSKPRDGGSSNDNFDSETTLIGSGGRILGSYPVLSTISSGSGGPWYRPDVDQRRIAALIENNALWIRRYVLG
ncbi:hypothetical protein [Bosea sp. PAMC 26642]|uniref:hypothetical protein n=1 Tax=Bosea sp. (strain PAMC 26642) TaxID=1792307 RepID=UPI0007703088|nr:hypothetical protein [Bosea sp. PAMC 26642]AMJ60738.1 hypothetical protein AXW83_10960 [Bosea sp. PAMC 26642]